MCAGGGVGSAGEGGSSWLVGNCRLQWPCPLKCRVMQSDVSCSTPRFLVDGMEPTLPSLRSVLPPAQQRGKRGFTMKVQGLELVSLSFISSSVKWEEHLPNCTVAMAT